MIILPSLSLQSPHLPSIFMIPVWFLAFLNVRYFFLKNLLFSDLLFIFMLSFPSKTLFFSVVIVDPLSVTASLTLSSHFAKALRVLPIKPLSRHPCFLVSKHSISFLFISPFHFQCFTILKKTSSRLSTFKTCFPD